MMTLTVIPEPISKVDASNSHLVELLAASGTGHGQQEKGVFDVAMTP